MIIITKIMIKMMKIMITIIVLIIQRSMTITVNKSEIQSFLISTQPVLLTKNKMIRKI